MGVQLTPDEIEEMLRTSHTGIVTTLRADGMPVTLPMWFAYLNGHVYFRTPGQAKKVRRIDNDSRLCFLVESGEKWAELKAVVITGTAESVDDEDVRDAFEAAMAAKYGGATTKRTEMPDATKKHYTANRPRLFRVVPEKDTPVTWDNAKIRLKKQA
jgi:PPOX class probable F420-dependent enzyme